MKSYMAKDGCRYQLPTGTKAFEVAVRTLLEAHVFDDIGRAMLHVRNESPKSYDEWARAGGVFTYEKH